MSRTVWMLYRQHCPKPAFFEVRRCQRPCLPTEPDHWYHKTLSWPNAFERCATRGNRSTRSKSRPDQKVSILGHDRWTHKQFSQDTENMAACWPPQMMTIGF